jgi:hypothetical protein
LLGEKRSTAFVKNALNQIELPHQKSIATNEATFQDGWLSLPSPMSDHGGEGECRGLEQ